MNAFVILCRYYLGRPAYNSIFRGPNMYPHMKAYYLGDTFLEWGPRGFYPKLIWRGPTSPKPLYGPGF